MADWNSSAPADNAVISQFPANERAARAAVATNFGVDHHDDVDANIGKHEQVTFIQRGSDPSTVADTGTLYTKNVSGTTEVFFKDEAGNVSQLTKGGRVVGQQKPVTKTSDYTAVAGDNILVDKSAHNIDITLPATPAAGDEPITITHIIGVGNTLRATRNGNPIMGLAEDMTIDANYASITLYWGGASAGWRLGILG